MKRLLVTGASGLLGANIIKMASDNFEVFGSFNKNKVSFYNCNCKLVKIDLADRNQLKILNDVKPDFIVHCAAFVSVDGCERNPELAHLHNVTVTENVIELAEKNNSFLVHISTDSVFDGKKGNYSEKDKTNPINVYGKTKLDAEKLVKKSDIDSCIVRTNIYGWNKINKASLAEWMINALEKKQKLNAFYDTYFTPILVNNLFDAIVEIYEKKITGVLHVSGSESCTKFEFANTLADVFNLDKSLIGKVSIDELKLDAKRGKNLSLSTKKTQGILSTKLLNVKDGLLEMKRLKDDGYVDELRKDHE